MTPRSARRVRIDDLQSRQLRVDELLHRSTLVGHVRRLNARTATRHREHAPPHNPHPPPLLPLTPTIRGDNSAGGDVCAVPGSPP
jgi:hypothetical protein